jgi:transcriptional regulator with XRE-family HTH domain
MTLQVVFGKRLKEVRLAKGLTQKELAAAAGLSTWHISNLERGINAPSFPVLETLASKLGIPVKELFDF